MSEAALAVFAATWAGLWISEVLQRDPVTPMRPARVISLGGAAICVALFVAKFVQSQPSAAEWGMACALWGLNIVMLALLAYTRAQKRHELKRRHRRPRRLW